MSRPPLRGGERTVTSRSLRSLIESLPSDAVLVDRTAGTAATTARHTAERDEARGLCGGPWFEAPLEQATNLVVAVVIIYEHMYDDVMSSDMVSDDQTVELGPEGPTLESIEDGIAVVCGQLNAGHGRLVELVEQA